MQRHVDEMKREKERHAREVKQIEERYDLDLREAQLRNGILAAEKETAEARVVEGEARLALDGFLRQRDGRGERS